MSKILLVDGNSIMNRAYYGVGSNNMLSTKEGIYTNALFGFLNILDKFIEMEQPSHICVAFDLKGKTFRHEIYKDYKAGRKKTPEELIMQFPIIKEILTKMGINYVELDGYEADDLIGTIKRIFEENEMDVTVLTGDRDMIQLASDITTIKIPTTLKGKPITKTYDAHTLYEDMNIDSEQFIHIKALMGDKSDNIPGVAGVGEKTALKLIQEYKSLDNLYAHIDEIKSENLKNKLLNSKENAYLSYELSKIDLFSPIKVNINDLLIKKYNKEKLLELFNKLEFNYFIKKYNLINNDKKNINCNIKIITDIKNINIEDEITVFMNNDEFTFTFDGINIYIINDKKVINTLIKKIKTVNGHYLKNFLIYLFENKIKIPKITCDTATIAYLLESTKDYYDLDEIFNKYSNYIIDGDNTHVAKIFYLKDILLEDINKENMNSLLNDIELPLIEVLAYLEFIGIKGDKQFLIEFSKQLGEKIEQLRNEIFLVCGSEFNINSPKQLGEMLFTKLKLPHGKKNKTGYSTSINVLEKLAIDHHIARIVIEYRKLTKLKSTYTDGLINCIDEKDNRIHSSFMQTVASTGRISSTEPNLQNLPIRTEIGREIRKAFICENDDYILISADYSQIELRILAHIANDDTLIAAFNNNVDIHTQTAAKVFGVDERMVTKEMRRTAKAVNFGIIYGISDFGLARDLKIPVQTARLYIEQYLKEYKNVKKYMDNIIDFAKKNGFVTTIFNRKRFIPELTSSNYMQREFGKRIALNTPIQGSAADIIKLAMNNIYENIKEMKLKSRLILQIHDELVIETHNDEIEIIIELLNKCMKDAFKLKVPLNIDINSGKTLYETK